MSNYPLPCGCSPENGVCCDQALDLMTDVRDALSNKGTAFGFLRLEFAKDRLAEHYREALQEKGI